MLKIEQGTEGDTEKIVEMMAVFYTHFNYAFDASKQKAIVENFLSHPHFGSIWLMRLADETVGYVALTYGFTFEFGGRDAFIDELFVIEKHRSKGFGAEAVRFIQSKMTALGLCALHLQVEKYNQNAYKLYEKLAFKDLKRDTLTFCPSKNL